PALSSRRAESALTLMGVSESRLNADTGPASNAMARITGRQKDRLPDGFILSLYPGVEFENAFVDPGFHAGGAGDAERLGDGHRLVCVDGAVAVVQGQCLGFKNGFAAFGLSGQPDVPRKFQLFIVLL